MRDRFIPPSYHRDLRKSLMRLEQGDKSVQVYYGELQKGLMHCGILEGTKDSICHFYSGLRHDIQDIVDYKEFNTVNQLFQLAMFAEKELQGRALQGTSKVGTTYAPRSTAIVRADQTLLLSSTSSNEQVTSRCWSCCNA
jgi:hypothetical protein